MTLKGSAAFTDRHRIRVFFNYYNHRNKPKKEREKEKNGMVTVKVFILISDCLFLIWFCSRIFVINVQNLFIYTTVLFTFGRLSTIFNHISVEDQKEDCVKCIITYRK